MLPEDKRTEFLRSSITLSWAWQTRHTVASVSGFKWSFPFGCNTGSQDRVPKTRGSDLPRLPRANSKSMDFSNNLLDLQRTSSLLLERPDTISVRQKQISTEMSEPVSPAEPAHTVRRTRSQHTGSWDGHVYPAGTSYIHSKTGEGRSTLCILSREKPNSSYISPIMAVRYV